MDSSQQDNILLSSPESSQASSAFFPISPSNYLTVPSTGPSGSNFSPARPTSFEQDDTDLILQSWHETPSSSIPQILEPLHSNTPTNERPSPSLQGRFMPSPGLTSVSVYSSTSTSSEHSTYSNPPARIYRVPSFRNMSESRKITIAEKDQMIRALRSHHVNTLVELRRIERAFAVLGSPDVTEPMTAAWSYYVLSHGLLTELRGLTKNYPFSSECLEEAKRRVYSDPQSNRSWNFCWLVLSKIQNDQLIPYYAQGQATQPAMWGGHTPSPEGVTQLSGAFVAEWNWALSQMLRHWHQPPKR